MLKYDTKYDLYFNFDTDSDRSARYCTISQKMKTFFKYSKLNNYIAITGRKIIAHKKLIKHFKT